jgi:hypothetical protein
MVNFLMLPSASISESLAAMRLACPFPFYDTFELFWVACTIKYGR